MEALARFKHLRLTKFSLVVAIAVALTASALLLRGQSIVHAVEGTAPVGTNLGAMTMSSGFAEVIEAVSPAVVSLAVTKQTPAANNPMNGWVPDAFREWQWDAPGQPPEWFWNFVPKSRFKHKPERRMPRQFSGVGAGVVFDPAGLIATNYHVIENAADIRVTLHDGTEVEAVVVGFDRLTDLAVLSIASDGQLPYAKFGETENVRVGDWALAIGDPFGLSKSVSLGIISAMGRNLSENSPKVPLLQVDAAVNRGNSGGPLFNANGEVIGINTMIISPSGASAGVGFAVPSSVVQDIVSEIERDGRVTRGWLGVGIQNVTPAIAEAINMPDEDLHGALVSSVQPGSPADRAGIEVGDIVMEFNGERVDDIRALSNSVKKTTPGADVSLRVLRAGESVTLQGTVDILAYGEKVKEAIPAEAEQQGTIGAAVATLTPEVRKQYRIAKGVKGVVITDVLPDSPAARAGLKVGDIIVSINNSPIQSSKDASEAIESITQSGNSNALLLVADGKGEQLFIVVGLS